MKYLITGGAGFIGSNFIKYMIGKYQNIEIVCLDLLTYASSMESIEEFIGKDNFKFVHGDICDTELVDKLFREERFDYVVNFAAESHVDRSFDNGGLFIRTNVFGTQILMDAAIKYKVKRFHQISTDEVYGELPLDRPDLYFNESSPLKATTPYSKSKALADILVLDYFKKGKLDVTISRSTNNYGIYQHPEKLIPKVVKMALNNENITLYGNGLNVRDWINVYDHCSAVDIILHNGKSGEIYNVGANVERSNLEIVNKVLEVLNIKDINIVYTKGRVIDDLRYALNCDKIVSELGWNAISDFDQSFIDTVKWYVDNTGWIERILNK